MIRYPLAARYAFAVASLVFLAVLFYGTSVLAKKDLPGGSTPGGSEKILLSGEIIADEISKATGVAISPILGISVLGAYTYYTTPVEERGRVPWHAKPAFWAPLLIVLLGIMLKDSSKVALPKILLVPLDAVETLLEKNASAALALLAILSSITGRSLEQLQLSGSDLVLPFITSAHAAESMNPASTSGLFELWLLSMLVTFVFGLVWVVSQSFNFLILLCPFSWLDLLLTICKNFIIALLLGAYLVNPYLGLAVSSVIILISFFLFARSYRFVIFGTLYSADIVFKRTLTDTEVSGSVKAFSGSSVAGIPGLSYGRLTKRDNLLVFRYRPWLIRPWRTVNTSFACDSCEVGKATLAPVIITSREGGKKYTVLFRLRPLYHAHENHVADTLGLKGLRDVSLGRSFREGFSWLGEQLGLVSRKNSEAS